MPHPLGYVSDNDWNAVRQNTDATAQRLNPVFPQAHVHNSAAANNTLTTATLTKLTFDTEDWDEGALRAAGTPTRLTAPITGLYLISGWGFWESNSTGERYMDVLLNNTTLLRADRRTATTNSEQGVDVLYRLVAGDYVELRALQSSGANRTIVPRFSMCRLGGYTNMGVG